MTKTEVIVDTPAWLSESFLENALQEGLKNNELEILDCEIKKATTAGENYGSLLLRINLTIKTGYDKNKKEKTEKLTVIVKTLPSGIMADEMRKYGIFEKEGEALALILPDINGVLEKIYPDHEPLGPICYYHQSSPNHILIMEDLRLSGFTLGNRFEGLDMEHTVLVLQSLAKLHAASLPLRERDPKRLKKYETSFWTPEHSESIENFIKTPFRVLSKEIINWTEFDKKEEYSRKLHNLEKVIMEKIFKLWEVDETKLNVILHGDSWVNNFMFRYDPSGKLTGIKLVDFQLLNINTPALELQYFIFTSIKSDIKYTNIDFFLKTYYDTFEDTLNRLEHKPKVPFDFDQLKKDFEDNYFWGFTVFCCVLPILIIPPDEVVSTDEFFMAEEGSKFEKIYRRDDFRKFLKRGLVFFDEKGVF